MSHKSQNTPDRCDALIVGGGLVGLTLGIALARGGFETIVVDALDPAKVVDAGFDGRVSAVAFASCRMMEALDLWDGLAPHAQPINDILVTDGSGLKSTGPGAASLLHLHFDHREIGDAPLGHLIENRHIRLVQQTALEREERLTLIAPDACARVERGPGGVVAHLKSGRTICAGVCLAADGRGSRLREAAGIRSVKWSYKQTGIVTTVAHEKPHHGVAQEYFLPSGPFAILPMTGNRASLVWTEWTKDAQTLVGLGDDDFAYELAQRFGPYLGDVKPVGPRWSYPLGLQLADRYVDERLALVGDAAHGVHPIAGQGLNLGLRDVAVLAEILIDAARIGMDPGSAQVLEGYQRWRRFDNTMLSFSMDFMNRLFSNDIAPLRTVRDLGLGVVNAIPPARRMFMHHAGGAVALGGEKALPKLLRGEMV
jgi:2-octaprenyl-6-methoxyphenol hydroxylase